MPILYTTNNNYKCYHRQYSLCKFFITETESLHCLDWLFSAYLLCSSMLCCIKSYSFENTVLDTKKSKYSYFMWKVFLLRVNTHQKIELTKAISVSPQIARLTDREKKGINSSQPDSFNFIPQKRFSSQRLLINAGNDLASD